LAREPRHRSPDGARRGDLPPGQGERPGPHRRGDPGRRFPIRRRGALKRVDSRQSTVDGSRAGDFFTRHLPTYLDQLAVERGLSPASPKAYRSDLGSFGEWLQKSRVRADRARREDLSRYVRDLKSRGLSSRSASRALSALRGFYAFAGAHLDFRTDPTA